MYKIDINDARYLTVIGVVVLEIYLAKWPVLYKTNSL